MVICDKENIEENNLGNTFGKYSDVEITTLNSFTTYLSNKNIALMKIDAEGHELKILQGGSDLITKFHVPFIFLEFSPQMLREVGSDPKELVLFLTSNGYKISIKGLLSKEYITVNELLVKVGNQINCYFIHEKMDELIPFIQKNIFTYSISYIIYVVLSILSLFLFNFYFFKLSFI